jgi:hypothetical protein
MSVSMRWEQCCDSEGCTKPAHIGSLCAACFQAATPARRAVELLADQPSDQPAITGPPYVDAAGMAWLQDLWAA